MLMNVQRTLGCANRCIYALFQDNNTYKMLCVYQCPLTTYSSDLLYSLLFPSYHHSIIFQPPLSHHIQDIVISSALVVLFVAAGLTQAVYAHKWSNPPDACQSSTGKPCSDYAWGHITLGAAVSLIYTSVVAYKVCTYQILFL